MCARDSSTCFTRVSVHNPHRNPTYVMGTIIIFHCTESKTDTQGSNLVKSYNSAVQVPVPNTCLCLTQALCSEPFGQPAQRTGAGP